MENETKRLSNQEFCFVEWKKTKAYSVQLSTMLKTIWAEFKSMFHIHFKTSTKGIILLVTLTFVTASSLPSGIGQRCKTSIVLISLYTKIYFFLSSDFVANLAKWNINYSWSVIILLPYSLAHRFTSLVSDSSETTKNSFPKPFAYEDTHTMNNFRLIQQAVFKSTAKTYFLCIPNWLL